MLYESSGVRVEAYDGIATLWLDFPGEPVNALSPFRLEEIGGGITAAVETPGVEILVICSAKPAWFCGGIDHDSVRNRKTDEDRVEFARAGQQVLSRLAVVPFPTVAYIHGPCLGAGLELALACDSRLAVAGPDSAIGFPDAGRGLLPCWGGATRLARQIGRKAAAGLLHTGQILSGREAQRLGLIDDAFCERRAKIELRTFLDHLQRTGSKPRRWWRPRRQLTPTCPTVSSIPTEVFDEVCRVAERSQNEGEAHERKWFSFYHESEAVQARIDLSSRTRTVDIAGPVVGFTGEWTIETVELAGRAALRGQRVLVPSTNSGSSLFFGSFFDTVVKRGFVTPLEADQARRRIEHSDKSADEGLMVQACEADVTATLAGDHSFSLGLPFSEFGSNVAEIGCGPHASEPSTNRLFGWLTQLGFDPVVVADRPGLVVRRILYALFDEAVRLAAEGVPFPLIDTVGATVLPSSGPLRRIDTIGVERVARSVKRLLPMAAVETSFYRNGRKHQLIPNDEAGVLLWDSRFAAAVSESDCSVARPAGDLPEDVLAQEIADRLEFRTINEAAQCLHDDPFASPVEIDKLAANGAGVFVTAGGPLAVADSRNPSICVQVLQRLAMRLGPRFQPCPGLVRRAVEGEYFRKVSRSESGRTSRRRVA